MFRAALYTEVDGFTALFCELEDIPVRHYNRTFYITEGNLKQAAQHMIAQQIITQERIDCVVQSVQDNMGYATACR